jgi:hypothetical protein
MDSQFVIDCGSRSIKLHEARPGTVTLRATRSWDPINDARTVERVSELLADLTKGLAVSAIHVVGTAAARRDAGVADAIAGACVTRGWTYETLSQDSEAGLILEAFGAPADRDIVNAGGGSIQIVRPDGDATLLGFGISDLNARFGLGLEPEQRQLQAAREFVRAALPAMERPFVYSGGELSYLRAIGAEVDANGRCATEEFVRAAAVVDALPNPEMARLSPFDAGWIRGAVASNAIVLACLDHAGVDHYVASDTNIADGIISGLARRVAHAPDARL